MVFRKIVNGQTDNQIFVASIHLESSVDCLRREDDRITGNHLGNIGRAYYKVILSFFGGGLHGTTEQVKAIAYSENKFKGLHGSEMLSAKPTKSTAL